MIYSQFKSIADNCKIEAILHYIKVCFIQATVEAALSFFSLESLLFYTNIFINTENEKWKQALDTSKLIFQPIFYCSLGCLVYVLFVTLMFLVIVALNVTITKNPINKTGLQMYNIIDNNFHKGFLFIHCFGAICYFILSLVLALKFIPQFYYWKNVQYVQFIFICYSSIFGLLWNILGCFGDWSIHWNKVFNCLDDQETGMNDFILKNKFINWLCYTVCHLLIVILFARMFFLILMGINPDLWGIGQDIGPIQIFSASFLVGAAIAVVILYFKTIYTLHYNPLTAGRLYITIYDFGKKMESKM